MRPRTDLVGRDPRRPGQVALNGLVLGVLYVLMADQAGIRPAWARDDYDNKPADLPRLFGKIRTLLVVVTE